MGKIYLNEEEFGSSGGVVLEEMDYAHLNSYSFTLPISLSYNHKVEVEFKADAYVNNMAIVGNDGSSNAWGWFNAVLYNNHIYGTNVDLGTNITDKHTYIYNNNGKDMLDGSEIGNTYFLPTQPTSSNQYQIGQRYNLTAYKGRIYKFKITDITNDSTICDIIPVKISAFGVPIKLGLYDRANGVLYENSNITVGNE